MPPLCANAKLNEPTQGLAFGKYRVLERMKASGRTAVFKGEELDTRRPVVIKVLGLFEHQNVNVQQRFLTEMRIAASLHHPHIVEVLDQGHNVSAGTSSRYYVMEFVPGCDLEEHVTQHGPMTIHQACGIGLQLAAALAEGARHHMVHRELMPGNVRITPQGQVKLLDFGLARNLENRLTEPGTVLGNVAYMAPEQAIDSGSVDIRADIYGLGGTLFWCLTARPPFLAKKSIAEQIISRRLEPAPAVRAIRADIPAELAAAMARMMAMRPEDRFNSPEAVIAVLGPFAGPGKHLDL
jgi:serine/threonine protein kinase